MRVLFTLLVLLGFIGFGSSNEQPTADVSQGIVLIADGGDGYDDGG